MNGINSKKLYFALAILAVIATWAIASLPAIKRRTEAINCSGQMISILYASRLWADDHEKYLPANFTCMSNELCNPEILKCPGDPVRQAVTNWNLLNAQSCSYEIVNPGLKEGDTNKVFLRCKIHGFVGYGNGAAYDTEGKMLHKW